MRVAIGWTFFSSLSREPRLACLVAASSSNIHFGISGSWTGSFDHTHSTGELTLPRFDRVARRLNTWKPVYFGFRRRSPTLDLLQAPLALAGLGGSGGGYLAGSALSRSAIVP
ncbi:hypothetical protein SK803_40770 [Lentzea sp. BCCO 10_0856]|uniref:Secreted protein n=1 Tax=Lentzea miocenica TaxID=3095431 RepID=A0ABU4TEI6_9PSEU|nr:hypothetical protein [Lentzea sp. BCCO 10_0856]MDX8036566.1 hypothetical protein [Lentzea sp. BCCO 10_0856]